MSALFQFDHRIEFLPANSDALLRSVPAAPGVFSLRGETGEPYLTRAADLRRRLRRLLAAPEALNPDGTPILSRRLNLRSRVRFIDYTRTGSDFESTLLLYRAARSAFGPEQARRRLRLHTPFFLRVTMSNPHPRVYATNRLSKKALAETFGPFPSRAVAERYCDAVLDLFHLRRCHEDLQPYPDHPGCVYGEMNKCMQPCKGGASEGESPNPHACTLAEYAAEAQRVFAFFSTRGESLLDEVARQREAASERMDFEAAAALHKHWEKVRAASLLADELVRPVSDLRAIILQEAAPREAGPDSDANTTEDAAVFLLEAGRIAGPERLSTLGVRAVREQTAVGSSLFAQPLMLAPIPLEAPAPPDTLPSVATPVSDPPDPTSTLSSRPESAVFADAAERPAAAPATSSDPLLSPEDRARAVLERLHQQAATRPAPTIDELCDALSLFRRWYYRPEKQRQGEVFFPANAPSGGDSSWPIRRILNGAARIVLGPPAAAPPVDREAFKDRKTKVIHAGREGVERVVPVLPKRSRSRKAITPADLSS